MCCRSLLRQQMEEVAANLQKETERAAKMSELLATHDAQIVGVQDTVRGFVGRFEAVEARLQALEIDWAAFE
eukprot:SAG31_NODE_40225_length_282_cov_0.846995_1_plen_71_part_10